MKAERHGIAAIETTVGCLWFALLLTALVLFLPQPGWARQGLPPAGFQASVTPLTAADAVFLSAVDAARYIEEDARAAATADKPLRFAAPIAVSFAPATDGSWADLPDGSRIWRLRVVSPGAHSLNFGLTEVSLPPDATLHFYPANAQSFDGPYSAGDLNSDGEFWTAVIPGDDAVIEMRMPPRAEFVAKLLVSQVGHDYRGFGQILKDGARQGSCNNDVICPEGDPWRSEIRSEGVYTLNGSWICSGQMVNSNDPAHPPYFLTANHCGISSGNAGSLVVYWRFESLQCGNLCCGPLTYHQTGSTFKAGYASSDFCLVRLNEDPAVDFRVFYSGWDATTTNAPAVGVGIHHPGCDEKAISFTNTALTATSYLNNPTPGDGTHWRVDHWDDGTTEPGSSGSGLWDPNHRLVGQLHGGYASCSSITSDWYGRLAVSWVGGGSSATRLRDWLDPSGSGTLALAGWDPLTSVPDSIPPAPVADLLLFETGGNWADLRWTATGDDSLDGTATYYDVRYSPDPITEDNFSVAIQMSDEPYPSPSGSPEQVRVTGLAFDTEYHFALKVRDESGNESLVSNVVSGRTLLPPVIEVSPDSLSDSLYTGAVSTHTLTIRNTGGSELQFEASAQTTGPVTMPARFELAKGEPDPRVGEPVVQGSGGPDAFGYRWVDSDEPGGPVFNWVDIHSTGARAFDYSVDDRSVGPFPIGFGFSFYGNEFTQFRVCSNGFLSFTSSSASYTNQPLPTPFAPENLIAAFWDDLYIDVGAGNVYYQVLGTRLVVQYDNVFLLGGGGPYTFEVILESSGTILYQFLSMGPPTVGAALGIQNATGSDGLTIAFNTPYVHDNLAIRIASVPPWLAVSPTTGVVPPGGTVKLVATLDATGLLGGGYEGLISIRSNDPVQPQTDVPIRLQVTGAPDIGVTPDFLSFETVFVGNSRTDTVEVRNLGTEILAVASLSTDNPQEFQVDGSGFTLAPGSARLVSVTYAPASTGPDAATLTIESNDPDQPSWPLSLSGEGVLPSEILVSPPSFAQQVPAGEQSTRSLTIRNVGAGGLDWSITPSFTGLGRVLLSSPVIPSKGDPRAEKEPVELMLREPPPDQLYLFPSLADQAATEPLLRAPAPTGGGGTRDQAPSLETVLASLDGGYPDVIGAIPGRYDFSEGELGSSIIDGGDDMYDGGNYLGTDIGSVVEYSNGVIASNPAFGGPGRYFTRKYPGLFVLVADLQSVQYFGIAGNLGANGQGTVDGAVLQHGVFGVTYLGFLKRVYNAGDASVNHLIIVEYGPSLNQGFSTNSDDDYHRVNGLGAATRIYYLLYAGSGGSYIDNEAALNIMGEFLDAAGLLPLWLAANPDLGYVAPADSAGVAITFDATDLPPGYYRAQLQVHSNDPLTPKVQIPVDLHVTRLDATFIRGDDDGSGEVNISDPIYSLVYQFAGGPSLCLDAQDTNDDGKVDIADPIHNLAYQFADGPEPPAPFSACGTDPTPDSLDCWSHPFCEGAPLPAGRSPAGEDVAVTLTLGQVISLGDGRVGYPVSLDTDVPLWGFEYAVRCVPGGPVFVGVTDSGCDYSHGQMDAAGGRVRVGNVFRLSLFEALSPGAHEVGYLAFDPAPGIPPPALEFIEGIYVAEGGASGPIAGGSSPSVAGEAADIPDRLVCRVVPNPFGSSTVVHYSTPTAGRTSVEIYNAAGQRIRRLGHAEAIRGWHEATWDGTTEAGSPVAGGIYFVRVRAAGETKTERVILLK